MVQSFKEHAPMPDPLPREVREKPLRHMVGMMMPWLPEGFRKIIPF